MEYDQLSASDGTGEAVLANIESDRAIAAVTINVDSVENFPNEFIFCTGDKTVNNFIDPDTMTIGYGHLDSGDVIIDGFAPGYVDDGNTSGQILIIKPTTYWADEIVRLARISHSDDGKLKASAPIDGGTTLGQGWLSSEEEWEYASWDNTTKIGTITVPTDATTKYSAGMRIRFSQVTGGTKYGIITKVAATLLTVYFGTDYTLNNEDITAPCFAIVKAPLGFPLNPTKWTLTFTDSTNQATPTTNYAQFGSNQLTVPIGAWLISIQASLYITHNGNNPDATNFSALSKVTNNADDLELTFVLRGVGVSGLTGIISGLQRQEKYVELAAPTTYYHVGKDTILGGGVRGDLTTTVIKAICAYL